MAAPDMATPATALCGKPAPIVDHSFAGKIDGNLTLIDLQAQRISRVFALPEALAFTIASLHYRELAS
jgi:S-adenosylhomocysteine hydrolase